MNFNAFDRYQHQASLVLDRAALTANTGIAMWQKSLPYAIEFGWNALDTVIAASLWTVDLGRRFRDWTEDPQNKVRVNHAAHAVAAVGQQALDAWCVACAATIEAGYRSRPHFEKACDQMRSRLTALALLIRFVLALRVLLARLDWEEIEEYQAALPPASQPVALLAPAPTAISAPTERLSLRKLRAIAKEQGIKSRNPEGRPWRKAELLAVLSCGRG